MAVKRAMIEPRHSKLSIRRQCEWVGLNRASGYAPAQPVVESEQTLRLMRRMDIASVAPAPGTSQAHPQHPRYPYLLRGVSVNRSNQVWSTDVTYIRLEHSFAYLVAVMDGYSRKVLSWRLSNTLETGFCLEALTEALTEYGTPEIFNTDQGCQFTSEEFTGALKAHDIRTRPGLPGSYLRVGLEWRR